ncbi:MAG: 50S ribosomal protein L13 [Candidatus Woesearchaeota archaeon]
MIINGENLIVGRVATVVAKRALLGDKIDIVNCEKMVITGKRDEIISRYQTARKRGIHTKGPFIKRHPDRFVRRIIRGMLPYKQTRGRVAFKNIMCYIGVPDVFNGKEIITIDNANVSMMNNLNYMQVGRLMKLLGGNYE